MGKFAVLKNIFLILILIGSVFMLSHYAEPVKNNLIATFNLQDSDVLGASSNRAEEITAKIGSDVLGYIANIQKQALEITLGDVVETVSRVQKIPHDIQFVHEFIKEQAEHVLQSVNDKE